MSPVDCRYAVERMPKTEERASYPVVIFKVVDSNELGIVFNGHGRECPGRAVLLKNDTVFEWVHKFH